MLNNDEYLILVCGVGNDENNKKLPNYCLGRYSGVKDEVRSVLVFYTYHPIITNPMHIYFA